MSGSEGNRKQSLVYSYFFNLIKTLCGVLFPIITFAYSSRVLGVEGLGQVNFSRSIISYFSMIAMLGINQYGTREAAKVRDDRKKLSEFTKEVLWINLTTTIISYILLIIAIQLSSKLQQYTALLWIYSISIFLSGVGMEWLYQALEEFKYIAIRAMLFQLVALIIMVIFVRDKNDVAIFAFISVIASSGSLIINFINARKFVDLNIRSVLNLKRHLRPMLWLFAMAVSIELYTVLDTTMLGFIKGDNSVGLYTAAIKVNRIVNNVITALGVVMIPRLSYYIANKEDAALKKLICKGYNYVFMLAVPAAIGLFVLSDDIIQLFSGNDFCSASITMRIMTIIVLFIPFSVMTNNQILVPMGKEKLILLSTIIGAISNIISNAILIPIYAENGAAVGTVIAEGMVAIVCFCYANYYFDTKQIFKYFSQYLLASLPIICVGVFVYKTRMGLLCRLSVTIALSFVAYVIILRLFRNIYLLDIIAKMRKKMCNIRNIQR